MIPIWKRGEQRLLVSVRGKIEALEAVEGGAHIADVEYPASALGTPYPLNIRAVRIVVPSKVKVSTNIGESQLSHGTACQAAIGVAISGADIVKAGLGKMSEKEATYLGRSIVRTIRTIVPTSQVILALFADPMMVKDYLDPMKAGPSVGSKTGAHGILVDTFDKELGRGLLDYLSISDIERFVDRCHSAGLEAWVAGSITRTQMPSIWRTGVDVICVRGAACEPSKGKARFGKVTADRVRKLVGTIPGNIAN